MAFLCRTCLFSSLCSSSLAFHFLWALVFLCVPLVLFDGLVNKLIPIHDMIEVDLEAICVGVRRVFLLQRLASVASRSKAIREVTLGCAGGWWHVRSAKGHASSGGLLRWHFGRRGEGMRREQALLSTSSQKLEAPTAISNDGMQQY
ncbi:hypothetical protein BDM02DRAFT_3133388 [Thelephora ganbajun]|uniref:Uncharacterized protein n=1 Tax=Thelephora ganbajun TaxID=370292 RepID=A0ACB6YX53_THEGA|nr:hypothetical protein BDM02DRAFT_3133388 [Thelephora ganbajun]